MARTKLIELKQAGKVRFIGMSGTFPHIVDHIAMGVFDVFQIPYSAVEREHEAVITAAAAAGAGIVIRAVLQRGHPRRESRQGCNGSGGSERSSTTYSRT